MVGGQSLRVKLGPLVRVSKTDRDGEVANVVVCVCRGRGYTFRPYFFQEKNKSL